MARSKLPKVNKIIGSPYEDIVKQWHFSGMTLDDISTALLQMGFPVARDTVHAYTKILAAKHIQEMADIQKTSPSSMSLLDSAMGEDSTLKAFDPETAVRNDVEVLDGIVQLFKKDMHTKSVTLGGVLKAIEIKKSIMGKDYRGMTVWAVLDIQEAFDVFLNVLERHIDSKTYELILKEYEERGYAIKGPPDSVQRAIDAEDRRIEEGLSPFGDLDDGESDA